MIEVTVAKSEGVNALGVDIEKDHVIYNPTAVKAVIKYKRARATARFGGHMAGKPMFGVDWKAGTNPIPLSHRRIRPERIVIIVGDDCYRKSICFLGKHHFDPLDETVSDHRYWPP
jgi:hypothetical protein